MIEWFRRLAASPRTDVETALEFDKFLFRNVGFSIHARLLRSAEVGRALLGYPIRDVLKSNDHVAWREDDTEEDFEKHWDELVEALECILADMQYNEQTLGKACFAAHCLVNSEGWKALVEVSSAFRIKALLAHLSRIFAFSKILIKALRREHMTSLLERLEPLVMISSTSSSMATIRQLTEAATYFDATPQDLDDLYHEQEQRVDGSEREGSNSRYPPFTTPTHTLGLSLHAPLLLISHILSDPNRVPKSKIVLGVSTRCCLACTHAMDILPRSHNVKVLVLTTDGDVAGGWGPPDWMDESEQMGLLEKLRLRWVYGRLRYVRNKRKEQAEDRDFWSEGDEFVIRDYMPSF
ncbi:hypothetical protein HK101_001313 [Irineochytrium annulatum]|nr:hypothetical protein HK101_001313 [Irineochytrium annulatum]